MVMILILFLSGTQYSYPEISGLIYYPNLSRIVKIGWLCLIQYKLQPTHLATYLF